MAVFSFVQIKEKFLVPNRVEVLWDGFGSTWLVLEIDFYKWTS
jgi:hypothetical protein